VRRHLPTIAIALALAAAACSRDEAPPIDAAPQRPAIPRLARDTVVPQPRGVAWTAALHAAREAGYQLGWFDARRGEAELVRDTVWMRLSVPRDTADTMRTRLTVLAARTAAMPSATAGTVARSSLNDDSLSARAAALMRTMAARAARPPSGNLLADSVTVQVGADSVEACRGAFLGEWWVEIDTRRVPGRCATSRLFGIAPNVSVMQRIEDLPLYSLVYTCTARSRVPRGLSVAYLLREFDRCDGLGADRRPNVMVLRKMF
jgi:hypothetical protein